MPTWKAMTQSLSITTFRFKPGDMNTGSEEQAHLPGQTQ